MAVKNGQFQFIGTKQEMHKTPPVSSPSADPASGMFQLIGSDAPLRRSPTVQSPSANPKSGMFQIIGTESKMSRMPVHGWGDAYPTPTSERAMLAGGDNAAGTGGGRGRKKK